MGKGKKQNDAPPGPPSDVEREIFTILGGVLNTVCLASIGDCAPDGYYVVVQPHVAVGPLLVPDENGDLVFDVAVYDDDGQPASIGGFYSWSLPTIDATCGIICTVTSGWGETDDSSTTIRVPVRDLPPYAGAIPSAGFAFQFWSGGYSAYYSELTNMYHGSGHPVAADAFSSVFAPMFTSYPLNDLVLTVYDAPDPTQAVCFGCDGHDLVVYKDATDPAAGFYSLDVDENERSITVGDETGPLAPPIDVDDAVDLLLGLAGIVLAAAGDAVCVGEADCGGHDLVVRPNPLSPSQFYYVDVGDDDATLGDQDGVIAHAGPESVPPVPECDDGEAFVATDPGTYPCAAETGGPADQLVDILAQFVKLLDSDPPVTTYTTSPPTAEGANTWFDSTVLVALACDDGDGAGCDVTRFRRGSEDEQDYAEPFGLSEGLQTVEYYSVDANGNEEDPHPTVELRQDTSAPEADFVFDDGQGEPGFDDPSWYRSLPTDQLSLTLTSSDGASGVWRVFVGSEPPTTGDAPLYEATLADWAGEAAVEAAVDLAALDEGATTIYGLVEDAAGNTATAEITLYIDRTAPTTTLTLSDADGDNGWHAGTPAIGLEAVDNEDGAGVDEIQWSWSGDSTGSGSGAEPSGPEDGWSTLTYHAVDLADNPNAEEDQTADLRVDGVPPELALVFSDGAGSSDEDLYHGESTLTVTATARDATSGLVSLTYTRSDQAGDTALFLGGVDADGKGDASTIERSAGLTSLPEGTTEVTFTAVDAAGHGTTATLTLRVDQSGPVTSLLVSPGEAESGWFTTQPTLTLMPEDGAGIARTDWAYTGATTASGTGTLPVSPLDGTSVLTYHSTDAAHPANVEDERSTTLRVDTVAPMSSLAAAAGPFGPGPVSVTCAGLDATSGLDTVTLWAAHEDDAAAAVGAIPCPGESDFAPADGSGTYRVHARALDLAGLEEVDPTTDAIEFLYDVTGPSSQVRRASDQVAVTRLPSFALVLAAADAHTGVDQIDLQVRLPGQTEWATIATLDPDVTTYAYVPDADGPYAFRTRATDLVGNVEADADLPADGDVQIQLDRTPPTSQVVTGEGPFGPSGVPVDCTAADALSGVARVEAWVRGPTGAANSLGFLTCGSPILNHPGPSGTYTYHVVAQDGAGNVEADPAADAASVVYDVTPPTGRVLAAPGQADVTNQPRIALALESADEHAGVASLRLQVRTPGFPDWQTVEDLPAPATAYEYVAAAGDGLYRFRALATDRAGNVQATAPEDGDVAIRHDTRPPTVVTASFLDEDRNGDLDAVRVLLNEPIKAETASTAGWSVAGHSLRGVGAAPEPDRFVLLLNEAGPRDTGSLPAVTYTSVPSMPLQDTAGNALASTTTVEERDAAAPRLLSAATADVDRDGRTVQGLTVGSTEGDLVLAFSEASDPDTDATPSLTYAAGSFADKVGNALPSVTAIELLETDGAAPVLLHVVGQVDSTAATIVFSEPVHHQGGGALQLGDFVYANAAPAGAQGFASGSLSHVPGAAQATALLDAPPTHADYRDDRVSVLAGAVLDVAANEADPAPARFVDPRAPALFLDAQPVLTTDRLGPTTVLVRWTLNATSGLTDTTTRVVFGVGGSLDRRSSVVAGLGPAFVRLEGLEASTTYQYRVLSNATAGSHPVQTVQLTLTTPARPTLGGVRVTDVTPTSARLEFTLAANGAGLPRSTVSIGAGTAGLSPTWTLTGVGAQNVSMTNLPPATAHRVQILVDQPVGSRANESDVLEFRTEPIPDAPTFPALTTPSIGTHSVTVGWTVNGHRTVQSQASFGPSPTELKPVGQNRGGAGPHQEKVEGLRANTTYYWKVQATQLYGPGSNSTVGTVSTASEPPPAVSDVVVTGLTMTSASVSWRVEGLRDVVSHLEWGASSSYGNASRNEQGTGAHTVNVQGLAPGTTIHYRVVAAQPDAPGRTTDDASFTTKTFQPPAVQNLTVTVEPGAARLGWQAPAVKDVAGYLVWRSQSPLVLIAVVDDPARTEFRDTTANFTRAAHYVVTFFLADGTNGPEQAKAAPAPAIEASKFVDVPAGTVQTTPPETPGKEGSSLWPWILLGMIVVAALGGAYYVFGRRRPPAPAPGAAATGPSS